MRVLDFDRYRVCLSLELPLVRDREAAAFDRYSAELVDADDHVCLVSDLYAMRPGRPRGDYVRAAAGFGSEFLARVVETVTAVDVSAAEPLQDVFILDNVHLLDDKSDGQVLQGMFVRALVRVMSRGTELFFIEAGPDELPFWREAIGARPAGDFVIATGTARPPLSPRAAAPRKPRPTRLPH